MQKKNSSEFSHPNTIPGTKVWYGKVNPRDANASVPHNEISEENSKEDKEISEEHSKEEKEISKKHSKEEKGIADNPKDSTEENSSESSGKKEENPKVDPKNTYVVKKKKDFGCVLQ